MNFFWLKSVLVKFFLLAGNVASITSAVYVWVENFTQNTFLPFSLWSLSHVLYWCLGTFLSSFLFIKKSDFIHVCPEYRVKKILTLVVFILCLVLSQILCVIVLQKFMDLYLFYLLLFGKWMGYFFMIMSFLWMIWLKSHFCMM